MCIKSAQQAQHRYLNAHAQGAKKKKKLDPATAAAKTKVCIYCNLQLS